MKLFIAYAWVLSLIGAIFLGNEIAYMEKENYANKLNNCNRIISGSVYEKGELK